MSSMEDAFRAVPRKGFLPPDVADQAELDAPLPIGFGSANSQPYTVRLMLEWLDVAEGQRILDVGSGSGWTSALLSYLTGPKGRVEAVEIVPELVEFGRSNCERMGVKNVAFHLAGDAFGWHTGAPYDRILVSASARELPHELTDQLAPGGRMVIPVKSNILVIDKTDSGTLETREHPGFAFVPLV